MLRPLSCTPLTSLCLLALAGAACDSPSGRDNDEPMDTDAMGTTQGDGDDGDDDGPVGDTGGETGLDDTGGDEAPPPDGDDDTGGDGADDNLEQLVASLCDWDFKCCTDGELDYRLGHFTADAADCTARFVEQVHSNDNDPHSPRSDLLYVLGYAVDLSRSDLNPTQVAACAQQVDARACNAPTVPGSFDACEPGTDPGADPCRLDNLFVGTLAPGHECSAALAGLGDIECAPGSTCEEVADGDWECVDKGLVGEFCEADSTCDAGLYCDLATGLCADKSPLSGPCAFADATQPDAGTETLPCAEGLSCDPSGGTCVASCSLGFDCATDAACPAEQSCVPLDIDALTYTYCAPRGQANGDRCDTQRDCADGLHCDGDACATDLGVDEPCVASEQCEAGLYCAGVCRVVKNAGETCAGDVECNPSTTVGCITNDDGRACRTAVLSDAERCVPGENAGGNWCSSGLCENLAADASPLPVCHAGAPEAAPCDADAATMDILQCAPSLYCDEGQCRAKVGAGQDCSDDQGLQCLGGSCVEVWQGEYCSDAPLLTEPGTVTCDGN